MTLDGGGNFEVSMRASAVAVGDGGDVQILGGGPFASGTTDAEGRCELAGLSAGDAEFSATHSEHAPSLPVAAALPASGGVDVALTLRVPGFVAVTVVGVEGKPVAEAEVMVAPTAAGEGGRRKLVTDAEGKATSPALPPGEYAAVLARAAKTRQLGAGGERMVFVGGEPDVLETSRVVVVVAAGKTVETTLRQPLLARVHGVVTGADGPVAGCVVELERGGAARIPGFGGNGSTTTTGPDGAYAFDGVAAGDYTVTYGREKALVKAETDCVVPAGATDVRLDLALRTGVVRLRALDEATGKPIAGADVEIQRVRKDAAGSTTRSAMVVGLSMMADDAGGEGMTTMTFGAQKARTDEQGVAVFEDVPEGAWSLEVTHKGHARTTAPPVAVVERQTADAGDVRMAGAGAVRGAVVAADGGKAGMALVECRRVGATKWEPPVVAMGGTFRMPGLAAGRYELRCRKAGPGEAAHGPVVEADVKPGETAQVELRTN
jgi:protocatechuate 3,4-dioxygenase beta subunit